MCLAAMPSTELDEAFVHVVRDVQLASFESAIPGEGQTQASRHQHWTQPHPVAVPRKALKDDREHGSG